jgi:hypothetical protein
MMRILGAETEERLYQLEAARGWKRSGLISREQLTAVETGLGPLPAQAGWAVRLLLFGLALFAGAAMDLSFISFAPDHSRFRLGVFMLSSVLPLYFSCEGIIKRLRLYRFGAEEGLAVLAMFQLCLGLLIFLGLRPLELILICAALSCVWLYLRLGYLYAGLGAILSMALALAGCLDNWRDNEIRLALACFFGALLALSFLRSRVSNHDKQGWEVLQAVLFLMACLTLNLRLNHLAGFSAPQARGSGAFYWTTFAFICLAPVCAVPAGIRRGSRPLLIASAIAGLAAVASVKPYLGLARNPWDPAVLGALLLGLSIWLTRRLENGRKGFTSRPIVVGRGDGPELAGLLAAAAASSAAEAPGRSGFQGRGGSSGGGGAGGDF